jgi:raffinose/stachyose/melibiose transport system substrate-binding protein
MKKAKHVLSLFLATVTLTGVLCSCGGAASAVSKSSAAKEIYFLNFKPEIATQYAAVAAAYKKATGVTVKVVTAASGTYEATLKAEMAKSDSPTIFQINGPVGYQTWQDYCADLSKSTLYKDLTDKSLAVKSGKGVYGIAYTVEGYGIIYNNKIMSKYFALKDKKVKITSTTQIKSFATLKAVVSDMTAKKAKLGIAGVFGSTSLATGEQWRWQTHLLNIPFYYEFKENTKYSNTISAGLNAKTVSFKYGNNYKNIFDLYINNSCTSKKLLGSKSVNDSMDEFALGKCAMVQNGNWAWDTIKKVKGNVVKSSDLKFLPIYTGVKGEASQGLCVGTENYICINKKASADKQKASQAFLTWLYTSKQGKQFVVKNLGFIAPFSSFSASERPTDPLAKEVIAWTSKKGITSVAWTFAGFPSEEFKKDVGSALLQYVQGSKTWSQVSSTVKSSWASEKADSAS